ncbi:uncharacterized protein [Panulirus ornatus]|uniref:uncharacterized protein n=1 Tax=Panulirus ornatus TaxID=150431 RepID=UPI003A8A4539
MRDLTLEECTDICKATENAAALNKRNLTPLFGIDASQQMGLVEVKEGNFKWTGLSSVPLQEGKSVPFASRSMSETEKNYAQIEREMLAIVYGLEKIHHFTYGHFCNDHIPQGMLMIIQEYHYKVSHKSGKDIPVADGLTRAPVGEPQEIMMPVHDLTDAPFRPGSLCEVREATEKDEILSQLKVVELPYFSYREEITFKTECCYGKKGL